MFDASAVFPIMQLWLQNLAKPYLWFILDSHNKLLAKSRSLTGSNCYIMGGKIVGPGGVRPLIVEGKLQGLPKSLHADHIEWDGHMQRHTEEWVKAAQTIRTLFGRAQSWQDLRDMFPDHVLSTFPVPELKDMPRTRPDVFSGSVSDPEYSKNRELREKYWDSKLLDMYEQVAPCINFYVSYRLL